MPAALRVQGLKKSFGGLPAIALPKYLFSGIDVFALMAVPYYAILVLGGALFLAWRQGHSELADEAGIAG